MDRAASSQTFPIPSSSTAKVPITAPTTPRLREIKAEYDLRRA
jgi:hypothetical protein